MLRRKPAHRRLRSGPHERLVVSYGAMLAQHDRLLYGPAVHVRTGRGPDAHRLDATFIGAFLTDLDVKRGANAKTRNRRLTAIRSSLRFVFFE